MTLRPTGIASFLFTGYDFVFVWDGSFLIPSNWWYYSKKKLF